MSVWYRDLELKLLTYGAYTWRGAAVITNRVFIRYYYKVVSPRRCFYWLEAKSGCTGPVHTYSGVFRYSDIRYSRVQALYTRIPGYSGRYSANPGI